MLEMCPLTATYHESGVGLGMNKNLTGRENIHLYGSILGHSKETMDSLIDEIIQFSELHDFIDEPLRTYSSGMKASIYILQLQLLSSLIFC